MEQILAEYKLPASKIEVYNDRVVFTHKGIGPITNASHICGTKIVYIRDITSVEFKEPTLLSAGYLQVNFAGKSFRGDPVMRGDEYSIPIAFKKMVPPAKTVWECINKLISNYKNSNSNIGHQAETNSAADEILKFKNLLDNGIITQEQFEAKKKQLLGL